MQENKKDIKKILLNYSVYLVLILLLLFFSIKTPMFLSKGNISNFFRQIPSVGILTIAYAMILITGHVDLSIASIAALSGTAAAYLAIKGLNPALVILIALVLGAIMGFINAFLITQFKLPSFILTLGTNYAYRGLVMYLTDGIYVTGVPQWFSKISQTNIIGNIIYSNTLIFIILSVVFAFILNNTDFGRKCYAVGSNSEAARLSGIRVNQHTIKVFILEGVAAAIAGILMMSILNVGGPNEGQGLDLLAMAAAILGGTQFSGGVGSIGGALVGILTLQVFNNGLAVLGVNAFMQQLVTGLIIIVAMIVDYFRKKSEANN